MGDCGYNQFHRHHDHKYQDGNIGENRRKTTKRKAEMDQLLPKEIPTSRSGWEKLGYTVYGCRFVTKHTNEFLLGKGSFGAVWKCYDSQLDNFCALKVQSANKHLQVRLGIAKNEAMLLSNIRGRGIPKVYGSGEYEAGGGYFYFTAMTLLGPNLGLMLKSFGGKFSVPTVCLLAIQMIDRLNEIHDCNVIHRDIKPDNFVLGSRFDPNTLYLCDFGFSKCITDPNTGLHIKKQKTQFFLGTPSFASINVHQGIMSSRRDDMESMMYVILFLLRGKLPWSGLRQRQKNDTNNQKSKMNVRDAIYNIKKKIHIGELFRGEHDEWIEMMLHVRRLKFSDRPDYDYLKQMVKKILLKYDPMDHIYDWLKPSMDSLKNQQNSTIYSLACVHSNSDSGGAPSMSELSKTLDILLENDHPKMDSYDKKVRCESSNDVFAHSLTSTSRPTLSPTMFAFSTFTRKLIQENDSTANKSNTSLSLNQKTPTRLAIFDEKQSNTSKEDRFKISQSMMTPSNLTNFSFFDHQQ